MYTENKKKGRDKERALSRNGNDSGKGPPKRQGGGKEGEKWSKVEGGMLDE